MKDFEYAQPQTEAELLDVLSPSRGSVEILGGGSDLVGLMKKMVVTPDRVVNICDVQEIQGIEQDHQSGEVRIGAAVRLDQLLESPLVAPYAAVQQAVTNLGSIQAQAQSTIGGELCHRPRCWYFRNGHGLLGEDGQLAQQGDNRYHAIFGNHGPAKFVGASRLAPALIALDASVRIIGPTAEDEERLLPLADLYRVPQQEGERETVLEPGEVVTHVLLPAPGAVSALHEVRHGEGPDAPLAAAAAAIRVAGTLVVEARIVMGQVAPVPWLSAEAAQAILGRAVNQATAEYAGRAATQAASPLSDNVYKVKLAQVCVTRAILMAAGLSTGGF